jgi:hypothetical protein
MLLYEIVVVIVAAFENLVNAKATRPLGDTFASRCAAWFAENSNERTRVQHGFRRLYAARSDILHGGDPATSVRDLIVALGLADELELLSWLRLHSWLAVDCLVGWYGRHPDDDGAASLFQETLKKATAAPADEWPDLLAGIVEGRSRARG